MSYELVAQGNGVDMVLAGEWRSQYGAVFESGRADGLVLNYALGFRERDLRFLEGLSIRRLAILARTLTDIEPVYSLSVTLEELSVEMGATEIDLTRLPILRKVSAEWAQISKTIDQVESLESITTHAYAGEDLQLLRSNAGLTAIRLRDRPKSRSLEGIEVFQQLRLLEMATAPLDNLSPLTGASPLLAWLDLSYSRGFRDLGPLAKLPALAVLKVAECGAVASVSSLRELSLLEEIYMWGSTRVEDLDLSPIAGLPGLRVLRMNSRRGYTPPVAEIKASIGDL